MDSLIILCLAIIAAAVIVITPVLTVTVPVAVIMAGRYLAVQQDAEAKSYREEMRHNRKLLELSLSGGDDEAEGEEGPSGQDVLSIAKSFMDGFGAPPAQAAQAASQEVNHHGKS